MSDRTSLLPLAAALGAALALPLQAQEAGRDSASELRETKACPGCTLEAPHLEGEALVSANLAEAELRDADFRGADLFLASFDGARLERADFREANLRGASFENARLTEVNLEGADLTGARFKDAEIDERAFAKAKLCNTVSPEGTTINDNC